MIKKLSLFKKDNKILSILLLVSSLSFLNPLMANDSVEYKIKAAYLYHFTKFVRWSKLPGEHFTLCISGSNPFGSILTAFEKRSVKGKPIRLRYLNSGETINYCQIVYSRQNQLDIFSAIPGVLTVGEGKIFIQHGGMIAFLHRRGKIKLQINLSALRASGLSISAKLLEVAEVIIQRRNDND